MNLFIWHGSINDSRYTVYALADDLASAKKIALAKCPINAETDMRKILERNPILHDEPSSFIMVSGAQLL